MSKKEMKISFKKKLDEQTKFYKCLKFRTKFAQKLYSKFKSEIDEELKYLINLN